MTMADNYLFKALRSTRPGQSNPRQTVWNLASVFFCASLVLSCLSFTATPTIAQKFEGSGPALIRADEMTHNDALGVVTASGRVEISQGDRVLFADTVNYHQRTNTVSASGHVVLMEPTGDTMFADYMELTNDLRDGVIKGIRILLADDSKFAAVSARRHNGDRTSLTQAVYSPCKICEENPDSKPLWRIKASRIVHDQSAREIRYKNATLEMFGIPVAYTPYFVHPDPTVDRKSGFLTPSFGTSGNTGAFLQTPYYWAIDKSQDATFSPIYTRDEGLVFSGEYRRRFDRGFFEISGSLAEADRRIGDAAVQVVRENEIRGHLFSAARYDIDDIWRTGYDFRRSSDRSYLDRFDFFERPSNSMESNAFVEGFWGRNYAAANAYAYQDLRSGQRPNTPVVLPMFDYNYIAQPNAIGGRFSTDANFRSLYRGDAADSQRISVKSGYSLPVTSDLGFVTTLSASLQTDLYYVDQEPGALDDGFTGRVFPQISADWRYPFVREKGAFRQLIEPVAAIIVSPNGSNPVEIPGEDSVVVEIDDTNLFSVDRFPGIDRVESGQRIVYGLNFGVFGDEGHRTTAFIGQSYRIHADDKLANEVGIERHLSDVVGRVQLEPNEYVSLLYRFRIAATDLEWKRNEVGFHVGANIMRLTGDYIYIDDDPSNAGLAEREELRLSMTSQFHENWQLALSTRRDLTAQGGTLSTGASLIYEDECFIFSTIAQRSFTRDAELEPTDSLVFRLTFKHLGEVETSAK
ncbi:MAG: LPS-assembly protein [Alphaproteobacteria bacterium]|jgi:LPS-assembly protein